MTTPRTKQSPEERKQAKSACALAWYYANRERRLDEMRTYRRENPEKQNEYELKRRGTERRSQMLRASEERLRELTPWRTVLREAKKRAGQRGLAFDLTDEWCAERWTGVCELTGIRFVVGDRKKTPFTASIDRKNPSLGYVRENCRFLLLAVNMLKFVGTDEDMFKIAEALISRR